MKEFMLLIRNEGGSKDAMSPAEMQKFLNACEVYIEDLKKKGNLKSAQPLVREGEIISGAHGAFKSVPLDLKREVIVGYYHVLAKDLDEAITIAKRNPEFDFTPNARVEVRPIKMMEESGSIKFFV